MIVTAEDCSIFKLFLIHDLTAGGFELGSVHLSSNENPGSILALGGDKMKFFSRSKKINHLRNLLIWNFQTCVLTFRETYALTQSSRADF